jgi:hypothetical protein
MHFVYHGDSQERQRRSVFQPGVAEGYPGWVESKFINPNGVVANRSVIAAQPRRGWFVPTHSPKVGAPRQLWAGGQNAVGFHGTNRNSLLQIAR